MKFGVPLNPSYASYYSNITGFIHAPVEIYNLTANISNEASSSVTPDQAYNPPETSPQNKLQLPWSDLAEPFTKGINTTLAQEKIGTWSWSNPAEIAFRVIEKRPTVDPKSKAGKDVSRMDARAWEGISMMHGRVELTDKESEEELDFDLEAVHFLENGTVYGIVEPSGCVFPFHVLESHFVGFLMDYFKGGMLI
jgi:transmembrane E3 ubiquitin-protein ligase